MINTNPSYSHVYEHEDLKTDGKQTCLILVTGAVWLVVFAMLVVMTRPLWRNPWYFSLILWSGSPIDGHNNMYILIVAGPWPELCCEDRLRSALDCPTLHTHKYKAMVIRRGDRVKRLHEYGLSFQCYFGHEIRPPSDPCPLTSGGIGQGSSLDMRRGGYCGSSEMTVILL